MRYGVCLPWSFKLDDSDYVGVSEPLRALIDGYRFALETGFDYAEFAVVNLMNMPESEMALAKQLRDKGIAKAETCNCFLPADLAIVGDGVEPLKVEDYILRASERLNAIGVDTVVFGSGGARRIPDGYDKNKALTQLDEFLALAEGIMRKAGIMIVAEPLNCKETNVFLTVSETAETVRRLNLPNLKLLADLYHTYAEDEPSSVLSDNADILRHIHVAQPESRLAPAEHPYLEECGRALKESGYDLRVSIESHATDFAPDMVKSLPVIKKYF